MTREYRQLHKFCVPGALMGGVLSALWIAGHEHFGADPDAMALYHELDAVQHSFAVGRTSNRPHGFMLSGAQLGRAVGLLSFYTTKDISKTFAAEASQYVPQLLNAQLVWVKRGA